MAKSFAEIVHGMIENEAVIEGVSIGKYDDVSTWRICFKDAATDKQRADAQETLEAINPSDIWAFMADDT